MHAARHRGAAARARDRPRRRSRRDRDGPPGQPSAPPEPDGTSARRVVSVDELVVARRIQQRGVRWRRPDEVGLDQAEADFAREGVDRLDVPRIRRRRAGRRGLRLVHPLGLLLFGGATLPSARGRGAYRALVAARAREAAARGTPVARDARRSRCRDRSSNDSASQPWHGSTGCSTCSPPELRLRAIPRACGAIYVGNGHVLFTPSRAPPARPSPWGRWSGSRRGSSRSRSPRR